MPKPGPKPGASSAKKPPIAIGSLLSSGAEGPGVKGSTAKVSKSPPTKSPPSNAPSGSLPSGSVTMAGRVFSSGAEAAKFAISMSTKDAGQALPVFSPVLQRAPSSLASSAADLVFSSAADPNSAPPQFERRLSISLARSTAADAGQPYSLFLSTVSQPPSSLLASPAVDSVSTGEQAFVNTEDPPPHTHHV
jgi:hypothetical protein